MESEIEKPDPLTPREDALVKALWHIATLEANGNSDPDVMAEALDDAIATAQGALHQLKGN